MLNPVVRECFDTLATLAIDRALRDADARFGAVDSAAAAKSSFHSGYRLMQLDQASVDLLTECAGSLLAAAREAFEATPTPSLAAASEDIAAMLDSRFQEAARKLSLTRSARLGKAAEQQGMQNWEGHLTAFPNATPRIGQELVAKGRLAAMQAANRVNPSVTHTYNAVGAVQHGAHASAQVIQHNAAPQSAEVLAALAELRAAVEASSVAKGRQEQVIEVLAELQAQAAHERPNPLKVSGLLSGLGGVIEGVANAPQAWTTVLMWGTALASMLPK